MFRKSKLARAIQLALVTTAASAGNAISTAYAEETIEEITVTGSRIVRKDYETSSPVFTLDSSSIMDAGTPQLEQVLNELPQLVPTITTTSNNPSLGGQAQVDLRGLGTSRTLVLMDGARIQPSTVGGAIDLNTIPSALIDSVEIVTGGGSAVYGSDAIAGVVNIKLKRNFEGVRISGLSTTSEESDANASALNVLLGGNFDNGKGNAVLYLSYDDRDGLFAGERPFSIVALGPTLLPSGSTSTPGGFFVGSGTNRPTQAAYDAVFGALGGTPGQVPNTSSVGFNSDGSLFSVVNTVNFKGDKTDPGFNAANYSYNFSPVNYLVLPLERRQIAAFAHYEVAEDVEVYGKMSYTNYTAAQELAATPISSGVGSSMLPTNPFIPAGLATLLASRPTPAASFTFTKRTVEVGPRNGTNDYNVFQSSLGVRGDFKMGEQDWSWDVLYGYGTTLRTEIQTGNVSRSRLASAYAATSANPDPLGCGGLNPFGEGVMSAACAKAIAIQAQNTTEITNTFVTATMTGGLVELPAGTLATAFGVEYRDAEAVFRPDEFLASGDVVGFNAQQPTEGQIDVTEYFVEFQVPILADMTGIDYLGLDAAYRVSDYNLAGNVDTYMVGLEYEPITSVKFRGSYNHAIAAPNVSQLFSPVQEGFPTYTDPCWNGTSYRTGANAAQVNALCLAQGAVADFPMGNSQVRALQGGNPNLMPESADTYTFGIVWTPDFTEVNTRVAVDWFRYEIEDRIGTVGANSIVSRCFNADNANPTFDANNVWCKLFTRNSTGVAENVLGNNQNLGKMNVDGVDIQFDLGREVGPGMLTAGAAMTYLLKWQQQEDPAAPLTNQEGTITINVAETFPEWKARLSLGYSWSNYDIRWTMNYIDAMRVVNNDGPRSPVVTGTVASVPSYLYHRLTAGWTPVEALTMTFGIANLTDKQPPIYTSDSRAGIQANTDPSTYDVIGRRYFLTATYTLD